VIDSFTEISSRLPRRSADTSPTSRSRLTWTLMVGWARLKRLGDLAHRDRPGLEIVEDGEPGGISQRAERAHHVFGPIPGALDRAVHPKADQDTTG